VHPERVRVGAHPALGPVFDGRVVASRTAGAGWELDVRVQGAALCCRVGDDAPGLGERLRFTLVDPPLFAADGTGAPSYREVVGT